MRSLEAFRAKPAAPSRRTEFAAASFAILFGAFGCEKIETGPTTSRPVSGIEQIKREGTPQTAERVIASTLIPRAEQSPGTLVECSSLQIQGNWQAESNAGRLNALVENNPSIDVITRAPLQINHLLFRADESQQAALESHRVQLSYRYARTVVRDPSLRAGDLAGSTRMVGQQLTVRPVGERLPEQGSQPTSLQIHYTANSYEAALGQALLLLVKPAEGVVDERMHLDQTVAIQHHLRFQGETCGPITTPGMTNSIYCMREFNETKSLVIDRIRSRIQPNGFVRVDVDYHTDPNEPATPGR